MGHLWWLTYTNSLCGSYIDLNCVKATSSQVLNKLQNYHPSVCVISTFHFLQCMTSILGKDNSLCLVVALQFPQLFQLLCY